ncbi:hypothetical protein [Lentzea sp. E54]|uniref:hypothetical protein n=1 Tax=Lentzea xerophila TaxID=3435883 RepID=UPI003DA1CDB1
MCVLTAAVGAEHEAGGFPAGVQSAPGTSSWTKSRWVMPSEAVVAEVERMVVRLSGWLLERSRGDAR